MAQYFLSLLHGRIDRSQPDAADGLQIGGGITDENARAWIDAGASKVTSVTNGQVNLDSTLY